MATVELQQVRVRRADTVVLEDVNLTVADGELIGVIGGSGSGKTTLLRAIGGLEAVSAGRVWIGGVDVTEVNVAKRDVAMVFQTSQLIPTRKVRGNVAFPLELRHDTAGEIDRRVTAETRALHIEALLARRPRHLSAGEAQLVQIARALVRVPTVLLLDEPLTHLSAQSKQQMRGELRTLQRGYGVTTFLATNEPAEAMSLPDRLVVLDAGRVVQVGSPQDVYERPASLIAASSTGTVSTVVTRVEADTDGFWLVHPAFRHRAWRPSLGDYVGRCVIAALRPTWLRPAAEAPIAATVTELNPLDGTITVRLDQDRADESVEIATATRGYRLGDRISFGIDDVALFDPNTGLLLL